MISLSIFTCRETNVLDKHLLAQASPRLVKKTKQFKQLHWNFKVLQQQCEQVIFDTTTTIS
jgi:hypothetical protein